MSDTENLVYKCISEQIGVQLDEINSDTNLVSDLGYDSLDVVELVMALEEKFEIEIKDEAMEHLCNNNITVKDVVESIKTQLV